MEQAHKIQHLEGGEGLFVPKSWHLKQPKSSSVNPSLIFQVARNSEHILIYICIELVLGIIISILQMDAFGRVDERAFVAAELQESLGHSRAVILFCFLGVNWRFSVYLAALIIGVWRGV